MAAKKKQTKTLAPAPAKKKPAASQEKGTAKTYYTEYHNELEKSKALATENKQLSDKIDVLIKEVANLQGRLKATDNGNEATTFSPEKAVKIIHKLGIVERLKNGFTLRQFKGERQLTKDGNPIFTSINLATDVPAEFIANNADILPEFFGPVLNLLGQCAARATYAIEVNAYPLTNKQLVKND